MWPLSKLELMDVEAGVRGVKLEAKDLKDEVRSLR